MRTVQAIGFEFGWYLSFWLGHTRWFYFGQSGRDAEVRRVVWRVTISGDEAITKINSTDYLLLQQWSKRFADLTRQCNFTHGLMREAEKPKCLSRSKK